MSRIDTEVLYLILTKVAAHDSFYNYDPLRLPTGQKVGTINFHDLGSVYERITGHRSGPSTVWKTPLTQLSAILLKCGLPDLSLVVATEVPPPDEVLAAIHTTKWPYFRELAMLYQGKR